MHFIKVNICFHFDYTVSFGTTITPAPTLPLLLPPKIDKPHQLSHFSLQMPHFFPHYHGLSSVAQYKFIEVKIQHVPHLLLNTNCVCSNADNFLCKLNDSCGFWTNLSIVGVSHWQKQVRKMRVVLLFGVRKKNFLRSLLN